ncbi:TlpA family protein disulfide reductase [Dawidia soli]|nr:TlpA disulfide reductase family protein [Dawidia soli]
MGILLHATVMAGSAGRPLKVGDKMPEYTFINLIQYPSPTVRTSDFRGKLLLLDFWATGCTACVESWPKLERLQQEFAGKIQILLINPWQNKTVVQPLIERRRAVGVVDLTLPSVCQDSNLLQLFRVESVPHVVWIDAGGVIRSISFGTELNAANIRSMLAGAPVTMRQKEYHGELSALPTTPDDHVLWQSTFSAYRSTMGMTVDAFARPETGYLLRAINLSISDLYNYAYSRQTDRYGYLRFTPRSKVQLATRDSVRCRANSGTVVDTENRFCYELVSGRPTDLPALQARMRYDLQGQFPYQVQWQKQIKRCLVFSVTDTARMGYKEGRRALLINDADFQVNNVTVSDLIQCLEDLTLYGAGPYPLVDETNFHGRIGGIQLVTNVYDVESLRRALLPHGLSIQWADRTVEVLVISDRVESTDR